MPDALKRLLEVEESSRRIMPSWDEVQAAVSSIGAPGSGFVILTLDGIGYIQTAGSATQLTVELREELPAGAFRHSVLGKPSRDVRKTSIKTFSGKIQLMSNEVLAVNDALDIFRHFYDCGRVPSHYVLRDTTDMFKGG